MKSKMPVFVENLNQESNDQVINIYDLWLIIFKRRKLIGLITAIGISIAVSLSFILTPLYKATTSVFPVTRFSSKIPSDLNISSFFSYDSIDYDINKIIALLKSNQLRNNILLKMKIFGIRNAKDVENNNKRYEAILRLNTITEINFDKVSGIVTVSIIHKNPVFARDVANTYISELNELLNYTSINAASKKIEFLEKQMRETEAKLKEKKGELLVFQKKTNMILPKDQTKWTMDIYIQLISEKNKLHAQLQNLQTALSPDSSEVQALRNQLRSIEGKIGNFEGSNNIGALPSLKDTPDKISRYEELARNVDIMEKFYETLLKLYEQTQFDLTNESLYVQVIDPAVTPVQRYRPQRKLMVIVGTISAITFSIFLSFFLEWFGPIMNKIRIHKQV